MDFNFFRKLKYKDKLILMSFSILATIALLIALAFTGCAPARVASEDEGSASQAQDAGQEQDGVSESNISGEQTMEQDTSEGPSSESSDKQSADTSTISLEPATLNADTAGAFAADGVISNNEYSGYKDMEGVEIYWANDSENVYIAMQANTEGFLAIGLQPGRTMKDADMVFGFVEGRDIVIYDMFSTGSFGPHKPDIELGGTDDIIDFSGNESGGFTVIEFSRKLITGDKFDIDISPGLNKLIWASGRADNPDDKHSNRGYGEIEIKN